MSEISGGSDEGMSMATSSETTTAETGSSISGETRMTGSFDVGSNGSESLSVSSEITSAKGNEGVSSTNSEMTPMAVNTDFGRNQILSTPNTLELAQRDVESYHRQSTAQILSANGKYLSESDKTRIENGVDRINAINLNPASGRMGGYRFSEGKSNMEISVLNQQQMERTTKHETNHFASKNREIIVPRPDKKGYDVYQTVGLRQSSWFHSNITGQNSEFRTKGRGMNEGLTTMYTNQQLMELSKEKGEAAQHQNIYSHATELCNQLESILGSDTLKEAYYGGNIDGLRAKVDSLAGEKSFESLRESMDKTLSKDYAERIQAMREAQLIMAKMNEKVGKQ